MRHRVRARIALAAAALVAAGAPAAPLGASPRWELQAHAGSAFNAPLPAVVRQSGEADLRWTARWNTNGFDAPLYYVARVTRWSGDRGWALDLTHHKLHLANRPREVQAFAISHGFNLLTVQRLHARGPWHAGVMAGAVVAHPETQVRGRRYPENHGLFRAGYVVAGPVGGVLAGRTQRLGFGWLGVVELRGTMATAHVPVAGGTASVRSAALHATLGVGWMAGR